MIDNNISIQELISQNKHASFFFGWNNFKGLKTRLNKVLER